MQIYGLRRFCLLPRFLTGALKSAVLLDFASSQIQKSMENTNMKYKFSPGQKPFLFT